MKNQVVLITGGTSGIGRACALEFGRAGARVVITGRDASRLAAAAAELAAAGIEHRTVQADVGVRGRSHPAPWPTPSPPSAASMCSSTTPAWYARQVCRGRCQSHRAAHANQLFGTVYTTKAALPHLLASKGTIVGISSIAGYRGLPGRTGYSASKFAMNGFLGSPAHRAAARRRERAHRRARLHGLQHPPSRPARPTASPSTIPPATRPR
ncbi:MAG: SDR family NAD(P)-dependent oxidoreductase [Hymenobacter sp.]